MITNKFLGAVAVALAFTACSAPNPVAPTSIEPSTATVIPTPNPTGFGTEDPAASVSSYGPTSAECKAARGIYQAGTTFSIEAAMGEATQESFEKAYTGSNSEALPVDALPAFASLKTSSLVMVGLDKEQAASQVKGLSLSMANFVQVMRKICS